MTVLSALLVATLVLFSGCSSVPHFKPSKPPEEASSLSEALEICASYQIKGDEAAVGRPEPATVAVLTPWIRCFELVFRKFPDSRLNTELVMFHRALQTRHDGDQPPGGKTVNWPVMNYAVTAAIDHLTKTTQPYSVEERRAVESQFPGFAIFLAENGRFYGKVQRASQALGAEAGDPAAFEWRAKKVPPPPMPLSPAQRAFCKRQRIYIGQVFNLKELSEYERVLGNRTYENPSNTNEQEMRRKIMDRVASLTSETEALKKELAAERRELQAKSSWFRDEHCLERGARFSR